MDLMSDPDPDPFKKPLTAQTISLCTVNMEQGCRGTS